MSLTAALTEDENILKNFIDEVRLDYTSGILMTGNSELYINGDKIRSGNVALDKNISRFPLSFSPGRSYIFH